VIKLARSWIWTCPVPREMIRIPLYLLKENISIINELSANVYDAKEYERVDKTINKSLYRKNSCATCDSNCEM
jgi:hypothetical protein